MSKKTLLNEHTVKRFMKLADLGGPLTSNFLNETYIEEEELLSPEEGEMPEMPEMPEAPEDQGPMPEMPPEGEEGEEGGMSDKETRFANAVADLADMAGVEVDFGDAAADMGDMPELPDMGGEEPPAAMDPEAAPMSDEEEEPLDEIEFIDEEEVLKEVYKRVTRRLKEKLTSRK
jgi:hypothetical protein